MIITEVHKRAGLDEEQYKQVKHGALQHLYIISFLSLVYLTFIPADPDYYYYYKYYCMCVVRIYFFPYCCCSSLRSVKSRMPLADQVR